MENFDISKLFDYYINHPTILDHTKEEIKKLEARCAFIAPEYISERAFYDFGSNPGLLTILQNHEPNNTELAKLHANIVKEVSKFDKMFVDISDKNEKN